MPPEEKRPRTVNRRFEFIEWKLFWEGALNRSDVEETFGISTPQASVDLRNYREIAGANIEYDGTTRTFRPTARMNPSFLRISADRLLIQLRAYLTGALPRHELWFRTIPEIDMAPDISRNVEPDVLRQVLAAIRSRRCVELHYQSLSSSSTRLIGPHALAFDGHRWHVRAFACEHGDFRDYVLTRMDHVQAGPAAEFDPADDVEWTTRITLDLRPHPGLTAEQRLAIERDHSMESGRRTIEVRLSMAYYFITRMNLDLPDLPPARAQICLHNLEEVQGAILAAKAEAKSRVGVRAAEPTQD